MTKLPLSASNVTLSATISTSSIALLKIEVFVFMLTGKLSSGSFCSFSSLSIKGIEKAGFKEYKTINYLNILGSKNEK